MITLLKDHKIKSKFQTKANFVIGLGYTEYNVQKVRNVQQVPIYSQNFK